MIKKYTYNGKVYTTAYEVRRAIEANENKRFGKSVDTAEFWKKLGVIYTEEQEPPAPEPTPEEQAAAALAQAKQERTEAVAKIKVTIDGMEFDGDEVSQGRMARTVAAAIAKGVDLKTTKRLWVLANNTPTEVTVDQLSRALEAAGDAQSAVWAKPYEEAAKAAAV